MIHLIPLTHFEDMVCLHNIFIFFIFLFFLNFRKSDEPHPDVTPAGYVNDLREAVDLLLARR